MIQMGAQLHAVTAAGRLADAMPFLQEAFLQVRAELEAVI